MGSSLPPPESFAYAANTGWLLSHVLAHSIFFSGIWHFANRKQWPERVQNMQNKNIVSTDEIGLIKWYFGCRDTVRLDGSLMRANRHGEYKIYFFCRMPITKPPIYFTVLFAQTRDEHR